MVYHMTQSGNHMIMKVIILYMLNIDLTKIRIVARWGDRKLGEV